MSSSLPNPFFDDMQPRAVAFDSFMDRPQQQQQQASMFYMQQQQQQQLFQQQHYQQDSLAILPGSTMTQFPTGELCVKNTNIKKNNNNSQMFAFRALLLYKASAVITGLILLCL